MGELCPTEPDMKGHYKTDRHDGQAGGGQGNKTRMPLVELAVVCWGLLMARGSGEKVTMCTLLSARCKPR